MGAPRVHGIDVDNYSVALEALHSDIRPFPSCHSFEVGWQSCCHPDLKRGKKCIESSERRSIWCGACMLPFSTFRFHQHCSHLRLQFGYPVPYCRKLALMPPEPAFQLPYVPAALQQRGPACVSTALAPAPASAAEMASRSAGGLGPDARTRSGRRGAAELSKLRMRGNATCASTRFEGAHTQPSPRPSWGRAARMRRPSARSAWPSNQRLRTWEKQARP